MRVALAQLDPVIADLEGVATALRSAAVAAREGGAELLLCPELIAVGGYPPRDLLDRRWFVEAQWRMLNELAKTLAVPAVIGCVEPLLPGVGLSIANAAAVIGDGQIRATYHKRLLPTYDVFDERRYFRPGTEPLVVEIAGRRVGITICEDIWNETGAPGQLYRQDPVADLVGRCDLIVNCSASPYHQGKQSVRQRVVGTAARRCRVPVVYCNQVGAQDELLFDGGSGVAMPDGRWVAAVPRWQSGIGIVDIDTGSGGHAVPEVTGMADVHAALVSGIAGYCRRTGQRRVVLGLSGGIDSALVAALAVDALGAEAVTGILMPGPYSSPGSITDAEELARNLGVRAVTIPVTRLNALALDELQPLFAGTALGLAEENLQSRLRGVVVMAIANKLGAMALTTGNKSELATGYCTIYGDMNGGLAPIGDLYKTQVWELSRWMNAVAGRERIPVASIDKAPSAELRPDQTDQDSLPPYDELDRILKGYLEGGAGPEDLINAGERPEVVRQVVRLVELNEFKRRQGAPVLRLTTKAFGVGRRMPIARHIGPPVR